MATITDLTGNQSTVVDNSPVQVGQDSNINVFEFGNLLLAGILPTVTGILKDIKESMGSSISVSDGNGSSVSSTSLSGSSVSIVDISGS